MFCQCTLVKLGFIIIYPLRDTGSGKSILLLRNMTEVVLLRNHKLDSSFLLFADAQDWETVFMLTDLIFCLILAKAAALYMAESYGLLGDFFLRATDYCLLIQSSRLPWACGLTIGTFLFEQARVNLALLNRKHL